MVKFLKKNKNSIIFVILITILIYIVRITQYSFSIDTEKLLNEPTLLLNSWYSIGRFGLCLFKEFFHTIKINIILTNILAVVFLITNSVLWLYVFESISIKSENKYRNLICMLFITSSPILCEQIGFALQSLEIMIALNIEAVVVLLVNKWIEENNIFCFLLSIVLLVVCFSFYQAYIFLYMTAVIACLLIKYDDRSMSYKELFLQILKYIVIFVSAFLIYMLVNNYILIKLFIPKTVYLSEQFKWGNNSISQVIKMIISAIIYTLSGYQNVYHPLLLILFSVFCYKYCFFKKEDRTKRGIKLFLAICFFSVPFILIILTGSKIAGRAQFSISYSLAFLSWYLIDSQIKLIKFNKKQILYIVCLVGVIFQCCISFTLNISAVNCFKKEKQLVYDINNEIINKGYEDKMIAIIGAYNPNDYIKGEVLGCSFFEWDQYDGNMTNERISGLFKALGYNYQFVDDSKLLEIKLKLHNDKTWFDNQKIYLIDDIAVVKLS